MSYVRRTVRGVDGARLAISIRGATKRFGAIIAVDGLDLDVPAGICMGMVGPNGAGKSTTMRLLTAQAIADSGEIEVLGFPVPAQSKQARAQMGVVPPQSSGRCGSPSSATGPTPRSTTSPVGCAAGC